MFSLLFFVMHVPPKAGNDEEKSIKAIRDEKNQSVCCKRSRGYGHHLPTFTPTTPNTVIMMPAAKHRESCQPVTQENSP